MRRHLKFLDDDNGLSVTKLIYDKLPSKYESDMNVLGACVLMSINYEGS